MHDAEQLTPEVIAVAGEQRVVEVEDRQSHGVKSAAWAARGAQDISLGAGSGRVKESRLNPLPLRP